MTERLDRIESVLEQTALLAQQTATRLNQVAEQQQTNTAAINQLTVKVDALVETVSQVDHSLKSSVNGLVSMIGVLAEDATAERDRFQSEIRRIWEHLERQGGNGRGEA